MMNGDRSDGDGNGDARGLAVGLLKYYELAVEPDHQDGCKVANLILSRCTLHMTHNSSHAISGNVAEGDWLIRRAVFEESASVAV